MKGDIVVIQEYHKKVAKRIVSQIIEKIKEKNSIYTITVAGESGSGKSETSQAIVEELKKDGIHAVVFGQDDYFFLPPKQNSLKRRQDPDWLGPHIEVNLELLTQNLKNAVRGKLEILKPLVDYNTDKIETQVINLDNVKVIITEGTYTSLLKNIDTKVFIDRNWLQTLGHRRKRNRGNEVNDPFTESILAIEHKIIAGHKYLADFVVTDDYDVKKVD